MTNWRKRFLILGLLIVLALAVGIALVLSARVTGPPHEEGATHAIAQAYMAAVMEGDKRAAIREASRVSEGPPVPCGCRVFGGGAR